MISSTVSSEQQISDRIALQNFSFVWEVSNFWWTNAESNFKIEEPSWGTHEIAAAQPYASRVRHRHFVIIQYSEAQ